VAKRARASKTSSSSKSYSLVQNVADTISSHPRMSAAVAFELGILLGQLVNQRQAALRAVKRAPSSVAAAMPSLPFFNSRSTAPQTDRRKTGARRRKTTGRRKK
jgi:hypothetical protein